MPNVKYFYLTVKSSVEFILNWLWLDENFIKFFPLITPPRVKYNPQQTYTQILTHHTNTHTHTHTHTHALLKDKAWFHRSCTKLYDKQEINRLRTKKKWTQDIQQAGFSMSTWLSVETLSFGTSFWAICGKSDAKENIHAAETLHFAIIHHIPPYSAKIQGIPRRCIPPQ